MRKIVADTLWCFLSNLQFGNHVKKFESWPVKLYSPKFNLRQQEKYWSRATFLTGDGIKYSQKLKLYQTVKSKK